MATTRQPARLAPEPVAVPAPNPGNSWPVEEFAGVLGVPLVAEKPGVFTLTLRAESLGTRLVLKMAPDAHAVRLVVERDRKAAPWVIAQLDFFGVSLAGIEGPDVYFYRSKPKQETLLVYQTGQFQLVSGKPFNTIERIPPARAKEEQVITLVGRLARPKYSEPNGRQLWTAGLAEDVAGETPVWHNLVAWGKHATEAQAFGRGQRVKVSGVLKEERFKKDGDERTVTNLVVSSIGQANPTPRN